MTAAVLPRSFPQSSTGRFEVSSVARPRPSGRCSAYDYSVSSDRRPPASHLATRPHHPCHRPSPRGLGLTRRLSDPPDLRRRRDEPRPWNAPPGSSSAYRQGPRPRTAGATRADAPSAPGEGQVQMRRRLSDAGGGARGPPRSTGAGKGSRLPRGLGRSTGMGQCSVTGPPVCGSASTAANVEGGRRTLRISLHPIASASRSPRSLDRLTCSMDASSCRCAFAVRL